MPEPAGLRGPDLRTADATAALEALERGIARELAQTVMCVMRECTAVGVAKELALKGNLRRLKVALQVADALVSPPAVQSRRFTPDQEAVIDLAKQAKRTGVTLEEAQNLVDMAREAGLPARGPESHPGRPHGRRPHIHIGTIDHIPVR